MPISLLQLNRLQNFKKYVCDNCSVEYFATRPSKHCSPSCKQAKYRERLANEEAKERIEVIGFKNPSTNSSVNEPHNIENVSAKALLLAAENRLKQIVKK